MTFTNVDNTRLNNRLYSVTGTFNLAFIIACFYQQPRNKTMHYLPKTNVFKSIIAGMSRDFINLHRGTTTLIPIGPSPKLTASQHPAVSSLEAYPTPAR